MKCVCVKTCQAVLDSGYIKFFKRGEVEDFEVCPPHFEPIEAAPVDFEKDSEEALMEKKFAPKEAVAFIRKMGNTKFKFDAEAGKKALVDAILDARYRKVD